MNGALIVSITAPTSIACGAQFVATVTVKNTGTTTWQAGGWTASGHPASAAEALSGNSGFNIGSQTPQDNARWGTMRADFDGYPVMPGQTVTATIHATAPSVPGIYSFDWKVLQDWVEWFGGLAHQVIAAQQSGGGTMYVIPGFQSEVRPLPPDPEDGSIVGDVILNTGVYPISSTFDVHTIDWINTTGRTLLLQESALWTGVDKDAICDVGVYAVRVRDNALIQWHPWDHYANPVAPDQLKSRHHTPPMTLVPNDVIRLYYVAMFGGSTAHAAHILEVRVTYKP